MRTLFALLLLLPASAAGARVRLEVGALTQFDTDPTSHTGFTLDAAVALAPPLRLHLEGAWFPLASASLPEEDYGPYPPTRLRWSSPSTVLGWGLLAGPEWVAQGEGWLSTLPCLFEVFFRADAGLATTRVLLRPRQAASAGYAERPATFGDTGVKPVAGASAGVRTLVGRASVSLSLRNLRYVDAYDTINGCTAVDLKNLASPPESCRASEFLHKAADGAIAAEYLREPRSGWTSVWAIDLHAGVAF